MTRAAFVIRHRHPGLVLTAAVYFGLGLGLNMRGWVVVVGWVLFALALVVVLPAYVLHRRRRSLCPTCQIVNHG
jgi:4-amino-4-deoxy-L-arabinose transferase-like glycosyltransferase